jgi:hypothetical protein
MKSVVQRDVGAYSDARPADLNHHKPPHVSRLPLWHGPPL